MIFAAHYFVYKLLNNDFSLFNRIDNTEKRLYPGKFHECFGPWYQYLRKSAPDEHILLFRIPNSPIPIEESLKFVTEPIEFLPDDGYEYSKDIKFHVKTISKKIEGPQQFPTVNDITRCFLNGLLFAYHSNNDYLWMDCDCFTNSNLKKYTEGYDFFSTNISHGMLSSNVHFVHISNKRLHELDWLCDLPKMLWNCAYNGCSMIRQATFFEGGLYKLFCYGNYNTSENINTTHLTTYPHFIEFLKKNHLPSEEYKILLTALENISPDILNNCKLEFRDEVFYET